MKQKLTYLCIEIKRGISLIPFFIRSFLVSFILLSLVILAAAILMNKAGNFDKMQIDVYIDNEGTMERINSQTRLAAGMVARMDSFQSISRFVFKDSEEQARRDVAEGKAAAAIILTSDFYDNINRGENTPLTVLVSKENELNNAVFKENVSSLVNILQDAESAVYALDLISVKYEFVGKQVDVENRVSVELMQKFFNRGEIFEEENISVYDGASAAEFYMISVIMLLIAAVGAVFSTLYSEESFETRIALRRAGIGRLWMGIAHVVSMVLVLYVFVLLFSKAGFEVLKYIGEGTHEYSVVDALKLLFPLAFLATVFHFIYTLIRKSRNSELIFVIIMMIQIICGGSVIPLAYFPKELRIIGDFSVIRAAEKYILNIYFGENDIYNIAIMSAGIVAFMAFSVIVEIITENVLLKNEEHRDMLETEKHNGYRAIELPYPLRWIWVILKRSISIQGILALCVFVLGFIYLYNKTVFPYVSNMTIGICADERNEYAKDLLDRKTGFNYTRYPDEELLRDDVASGKADCGFVISDDIDKIKFITSSSSTKGYVAKERIYSSIFRKIAEDEVKELAADKTVFVRGGNEAVYDALEAYKDFQKSDYVFDVKYQDIGSKRTESRSGRGSARGLLAAAIFAVTLGFGRYKYTEEFRNISCKLPGRFSNLYMFGNMVIPGIVISEILLVLSALAFNIIAPADIIKVIPAVFLSAVWGMLISKLCAKDATYLCTMLSIFTISILVCPVFFDVGSMFPVIKIFRVIFPQSLMLI